MASTSPKLNMKYRWSLGENGWNTDMDNNIKKLDCTVQLAVESMVLTVPPSSPSVGQTYIIPTGATGVWSSNIGKVAQYIDGNWVYYTPQEGWQTWVKDVDKRYDYDGTVWITPDDGILFKINAGSLQVSLDRASTWKTITLT